MISSSKKAAVVTASVSMVVLVVGAVLRIRLKPNYYAVTWPWKKGQRSAKVVGFSSNAPAGIPHRNMVFVDRRSQAIAEAKRLRAMGERPDIEGHYNEDPYGPGLYFDTGRLPSR